MRRRRLTFTLGRLAAFVAVAATLSWPGAATAVAQTPRGGKVKVYGQIHSPGIDPSVITVGASNTFGADARNDDGVATYSSRGPNR